MFMEINKHQATDSIMMPSLETLNEKASELVHGDSPRLNLNNNRRLFSDLLKNSSNETGRLNSFEFPSPSKRGDFPSIKIPEILKQKCIEQWKFSLIGRLDLSKNKIEDLRLELGNMWKCKGQLKLIPLGRGFFIIKIENEEDRNFIWTNGPWKVGNQLLRIRDWCPSFRAEDQRISSANVWVRFPGLSIEYWDVSVLFAIARTVGNPIQVDQTTVNQDLGYYASVLVEIDFAKPIPEKVWVEGFEGGFWQKVEVPKPPKFCNHCKIIGHLVHECRAIKAISKEMEKNEDTNLSMGQQGRRRRRRNKEQIESKQTDLTLESDKEKEPIQNTDDEVGELPAKTAIVSYIKASNSFAALGELHEDEKEPESEYNSDFFEGDHSIMSGDHCQVVEMGNIQVQSQQETAMVEVSLPQVHNQLVSKDTGYTYITKRKQKEKKKDEDKGNKQQHQVQMESQRLISWAEELERNEEERVRILHKKKEALAMKEKEKNKGKEVLSTTNNKPLSS